MLEIHTEQIKVPNANLQIDAYLAMPKEEGQFPGVVVVQEIFGVNSHIRDVTRRIAQEGYIAIAPAIYQRLIPGFETGYTAEDVKIGRQYKNQTKASELLSDINATINYLKTLSQFNQQPVGTIGFCFGGHVVYLTATLNDVKVTASFYGAGIATMTPGGTESTLTRTQGIHGSLYAFFGMKDASIPREQVNQIEAELTKYHIPHRIFRYPEAGHGFFCDQRASYNQAAAEDAWQQVKQLFREQLKT